jgi:CYTH domain-containing protein
MYNDIFIDVYEGVLNGLITAEYESDENNVNNFIPPNWFDIEITDDDKYKNRYLATELIK